MWHRPRPVRILILAVNLITAACGGGGSPASPSVEPPVEPETRSFPGGSFPGDWRGRYRNGSLTVMSRCRDQGTPLDFYHPYAQSEMTVRISGNLAGEIRIARIGGENEMLTCPFAGQLDLFALVATVNGGSCTPPNARVPAQGYLIAPIPPGCQSRSAEPAGPEPWAEPHEFRIRAAINNTSRDYPILVFNISETGHFHDPRGDYYTGTYTAGSSAMLTHPEDPRVE